MSASIAGRFRLGGFAKPKRSGNIKNLGADGLSFSRRGGRVSPAGSLNIGGSSCYLRCPKMTGECS